MLGGLFHIPEERREYWARAIIEALEHSPNRFRVNGEDSDRIRSPDPIESDR